MRSFSTFLARKYFFSLGKLGAIRLMSLTAVVGLSLGTAAMTVVLSAFAGLENLILEQFEDANPTLKVSPSRGQFLELTPQDSIELAQLTATYPETQILPIFQKRVLLTYGENQHIAQLLGVPPSYEEAHRLPEHLITQADPGLDFGGYTLSLGAGVAYHLGIASTNPPPIVSVYLPKITEQTNVLNIAEAIDGVNVFATAVHSLQPDFDQKYIIAPEAWMKEFTGQSQPSFLEIHTPDESRMRDELSEIFGSEVKIANAIEQEATLFKVMRSERLVILAILTFVVILASFGIVSALTIIALEKKGDIRTLWSMGSTEQQLRSIFFKNGMFIVATGWICGLFLGILVIALQSYVGIVPLGTGYIREYYPVELTLEHILTTSAIVLTVGTLLSAWATRNVAKIH